MKSNLIEISYALNYNMLIFLIFVIIVFEFQSLYTY